MTRVTRPTRAPGRPVSESDFQQTVIQLAKLNGWRVAHFRPAMNRRGVWATQMQGDPGFPDLVLAREGVVIFVELKRERAKLTAEQQAWRWALGAGRPGCNAHIWYPSMWDSIVELLAKGA